jgi:predicted ATPase
MKPVIRSLILKRFRSIPTELVDFNNPTFLVGANGSGKSNFVDAFAFLSDAMSSPLQAVFDKRGGIANVRNRTSGKSYPPNLGLGVTFGSLNGEIQRGRYAFEIRALKNYGFEVTREQCEVQAAAGMRYYFDRTKQQFKSNVRGLDPSVDPASLGLPIVGGEKRFAPVLRTLAAMRVYSLEPAKVREMQEPDSGVSLRTDGSNAASVLQEIERHHPGEVERIGEILSTIVPHTKRVKTIKHGNKISLQFTQEWGEEKHLRFESFNMSDGTLRALGLLMAVYQHPTPTLAVIEEPEATIHPGALGGILDLLKYASRKMQIIVTTHSPDVLDAKWIEDRNLRIVSWGEGATRVTPISESSRQALQAHLIGAGELLRSNALSGTPALFEEVGSSQPSLFENFE